jgi:hypothetical protein
MAEHRDASIAIIASTLARSDLSGGQGAKSKAVTFGAAWLPLRWLQQRADKVVGLRLLADI